MIQLIKNGIVTSVTKIFEGIEMTYNIEDTQNDEPIEEDSHRILCYTCSNRFYFPKCCEIDVSKNLVFIEHCNNYNAEQIIK